MIKLQQKLNSESLALAFNEQSHFETKKSLKQCQAEVIRLRAKILNLTQNSVENTTENTEIETKISNSNKWLTSSNTMLTHVDDSLLYSDDDEEPTYMISNENTCANKENSPQPTENSPECADIKELSKININSTTEPIKPVIKKKVSFTSDTLEPKLTNRSGRKVINVLPTHIPDIKKT